MTSDGGDALLFAIAARRDLSWSAFKLVADAVLPLDTSRAPDARRTRMLAASFGDALGHWDVVAANSAAVRVCVAPPALARLPWPGLPRAVLCGSRSPDTLAALVTASASSGVTVSQRRIHAHVPARIEATAVAESHIVEFAASLDIRYAPEPAAWRLVKASCSVGEYLKALEWSEDPELNWPRREFDPERFAFGSVVEGAGERRATSQLRLISYEHPAGWTHQDRLLHAGCSAMVDRSWARYAVLAEARTRVLQLDRRAGTVVVPRQLPLPKLIARALALCSGEPPTLAPGPGLGLHVYKHVPASILDEVAAKLGQDQ